MPGETPSIHHEGYDAASATFGSDEQTQRRYNELSSAHTAGSLKPEDAAALQALEQRRDRIKNSPITPEEDSWLKSYYNQQAKPDFNPTPDQMNKFMEIQRRKQAHGVENKDNLFQAA